MVEINTIEKDNVREVIVNGQIDASSSIHLDNALDQAFSECSKVMINLNQLSYISSAGLGVFIARLDEIKQNKWQMVLFGLDKKVYEVFDILGLAQLLTIVETKTEAEACFK